MQSRRSFRPEGRRLVRLTLARVPRIREESRRSVFLDRIREDLQRSLGTVVRIRGDEEKGKLEIEYYSTDDLERIIETLRSDGVSR